MSDFSVSKVNGIFMHDVQIYISRPSFLYPNIFASFRFPLDPKTGLFYDDETKIQCDISPYGWKIFTGFDAPPDRVIKNIKPGNEAFAFSEIIKVTMGDAKTSVGSHGVDTEFSLPTFGGLLRVWGEVYATGYKWGQVKEVG